MSLAVCRSWLIRVPVILGQNVLDAYVFDHNRRNGRVRPFSLVRLSSQASKSARLVVRRSRPAATRFHRAAWARSLAPALVGRVPAETSNGRSLESVATGSGLRISIRGRSIVGTAKLSAVGSRSSELSSRLQKTGRGSREQLPLAHISDHNHHHVAADPNRTDGLASDA